ncbi:MAG: UbiD family decarboxylase domain-containing protein [Planctomycetota bacterium]
MPARAKSFPDVRSFARALDDAGELVRVAERVSPVLEIAHLADLASKSPAPGVPSESAKRNDPRFFDRGGPALLFENVEGSDLPVLINAFGSYRRMEMALGREAVGGGFDAIGNVIGELVKPQPPRSLSEAIAKARQVAPLLKIPPKRRSTPGHCQEIVLTGDDIDLTRLPILRTWSLDGDFEAVGYPAGVNGGVEGLGHPAVTADDWESTFRGRYITLAGIHTVHTDDAGSPKPASHNIGMYRVQLLGKNRVAMHWHVHHDGASHWRSWKRRGERMPVAIVLGGSSVLPYGATAPLPPGISELLMTGFLQQQGVPMCPAKTVPLHVPADAEIVIEGYASHEAGPIGWDPRDAPEPLGPGAVFEGPFGDHTGFYSMPDRYPVVEVTAVTMRRNPVYPTTVVGLPPQEDYFLGKATERLFLPLLKVLIPDIADYDLPMFGAFHNAAFLQIGKHYPLQARRVMHAVWGAGQMAWTKNLFVVDDSVDVHDTLAVLRAAAENCVPGRDLEIVRGPLDILDHAAPRLGAGAKLGFDCTPRWDGEEVHGSSGPQHRRWTRPDPARCADDTHAIRSVEGVVDVVYPESAGGWCFVTINKAHPGEGHETARALAECAEGPPFRVVLDASVDPRDTDAALFHWCANCDASRDLVVSEDGQRAVFDATPKVPGSADARGGQPVRAWPPIVSYDDQALERVRPIAERLGLWTP